MFHKTRTWCVSPIGSAEELAEKLSEHTWTGCTAFELQGYLFLNDSTSADGAQEYAVLKRPAQPGGAFFQIESITFGWCSQEKGLEYVRRILAGEYDQAEYRAAVTPRLEIAADHGRCHHCA
jgi:hypothetical protein